MMSYRITTDSTSDFPRQFYEENDIAVVGLSFLIDEQEYNESKDLKLSSKEFYDLLRSGKTATTMQVNTFEFVEFIEPFLAAGEDVLHIAFSSGLSGTYESCFRGAQELSEKYPDRTLIVIDTLAASMGEGLLVHYAMENRKNGMSIQENAAWLEENKLHLCHWFTVNDLMHLHRGGRVSKASAIFGSLLGIKPVLHVDNEGHLILVSKSRGRVASIDALVSKLKETANDDIAEQAVFISHGDCLDDAKLLEEKIRSAVGTSKFMISNVGAVIGSHSGPGTLALFFMGKQR
ncbi:MAG: DegV family protein [Oscillospiraceae bacterium]|nr:DegV family protein [Oscillospiraceae bacterium]MDD4414352.1 DegV family protein [Oscillospiraceae bacterium]